VPLTAQATRRRIAQIVKIRVSGYLKFRGLIGDEATLELEAEQATLRDALKMLCNQHGERFDSILFDPSSGEPRRSNLILLNGQPYINLGKGLDTELKDGDEIALSPVLAGGQ
jgi:MoaD family protein